jgi:hypothetical protein
MGWVRLEQVENFESDVCSSSARRASIALIRLCLRMLRISAGVPIEAPFSAQGEWARREPSGVVVGGVVVGLQVKAGKSYIKNETEDAFTFYPSWGFRRRRTVVPGGTRTAFRAEGERFRSLATLAV